jgi:hypothetical protein
MLATLLTSLPDDERLSGMCEQYDFLSKLVLHTGPDHQIRVRLATQGLFVLVCHTSFAERVMLEAV